MKDTKQSGLKLWATRLEMITTSITSFQGIIRLLQLMKLCLKRFVGTKEVVFKSLNELAVDGKNLKKRNRNFSCYENIKRYAKRILSSDDFCVKCHGILHKNNKNQIQYYCTDICRAARYNINSRKVRKFKKKYSRTVMATQGVI